MLDNGERFFRVWERNRDSESWNLIHVCETQKEAIAVGRSAGLSRAEINCLYPGYKMAMITFAGLTCLAWKHGYAGGSCFPYELMRDR